MYGTHDAYQAGTHLVYILYASCTHLAYHILIWYETGNNLVRIMLNQYTRVYQMCYYLFLIWYAQSSLLIDHVAPAYLIITCTSAPTEH